MNTLGENLKKYRLKEKYMQETVAKYINKSSRTYSRYETGTLKPDIDTLIMLADLYQVSLDVLTGRSKPRDEILAHIPGNKLGDEIGRAINRKRISKRIQKEAQQAGGEKQQDNNA